MGATIHQLPPQRSRALTTRKAPEEPSAPQEAVLESIKGQGRLRLKSEALRYAERILKAEGQVKRPSLTARADMAVIAARMLYEASAALLEEVQTTPPDTK